MCVTEIQHVNAAIYFPLMFHLRQVANFNFFFLIQSLKLSLVGYQVIVYLVTLL